MENIFIKPVENIKIIQKKNQYPDLFGFYTHYINANLFYLFVKRLDGPSGWGQNLIVQIIYPNGEIQEVQIGASQENIKKKLIITNFPIIYQYKNNLFVKEPLINDHISYIYVNYSKLTEYSIKKIINELENIGVKILLDEHLLEKEYIKIFDIQNNNEKIDIGNIFFKFEEVQRNIYNNYVIKFE